MNSTFLDFTVIIGSTVGYFISISLLVSPFYKNRANKYLSVSLFILASITLLGWYNAEKGIFRLLQMIMWELLVPVTLFKYFLIQIKHLHEKTIIVKKIFPTIHLVMLRITLT
ncbi:hypothetical protein C9994_05205 [Marivirga lumbricoides]|uniref:Histidine kinase N-terminal 7TM region domain-containing protein n=1 Tax=Marivirga lumbricoides TaxID=1046115 RepID=A0A2T4DSV4_9BACT|nr:hypothetical protein C9994_05205 [Marivirga lumbricoides]